MLYRMKGIKSWVDFDDKKLEYLLFEMMMKRWKDCNGWTNYRLFQVLICTTKLRITIAKEKLKTQISIE